MMMLGQSRHVLGLVVSQRAIHVSEVSVNGGRQARPVRSARFDLPAEADWDKTQAVGAALAQFLKEHHFTARRAVVGLPGRWLLARPQPAPPTDPATAVNLLRLAVERHFPGEGREWVFDFAGEPDPRQRTTLLLTGTLRRRLDQVVAVARGAGLDLRVASATPLVIAQSLAQGQSRRQAILLLSGDGAEVAITEGDRVLSLERLGGSSPERLNTDLRRALTAAAARAGQTPAVLTVWNAADAPESSLRGLGEAVGLPVECHPASSAASTREAASLAAAATLGVTGLAGRGTPVDFLHSRLAVKKPGRWTPRRLALIAAAALLLLLVLLYAGDWYVQQGEAAHLAAELSAMKPEMTAAQVNVARLEHVRGWYDQRPAHLDCLRALTLAFPGDTPGSGQVWATNLAVRDDHSGTLAGRASEEKAVLDLLERIKKSSFTEVKLLYMRQAERAGQGVSFALAFTFIPTPPSEPGR